jgi:integrase
LLARLGLRAGEVVSLQLDDVDWRAGELLVRGKGLSHDRMPLPVDVGDPTRGRSALHVGLAFGYGPALRRVAQCDGAANRGPGAGPPSSSVSTKDASHL